VCTQVRVHKYVKASGYAFKKIQDEESEEEEEGVYEIEIDGTRYYTTNEQNGIVYEAAEDDEVGDPIGKFVNGKFVFDK
jgi:hypothetical protein